MAIVTIVFAGLLFALGLGAYFGTGTRSFTALIPAAFGLVFGVLGVLALRPNLRKHTMHAAAAVALLALLGTVRSFGSVMTLVQGGTVERPQAAVVQAIMAVLCIGFIALCVRSFVAARTAMRGQA
jgi:hypothetical protein